MRTGRRMEEREPDELASSSTIVAPAAETGPYVLRTLLQDIPLSADGNGDDIEINCVEFLGMWSYQFDMGDKV